MANTEHQVTSREQWNQARRELMQQEKQLTQLREQLSEKRRALPWVRVDQSYSFQAPDGPRTLSELFGSKSQLLVYHFMFAPEWEGGCPSCSFWADSFSGSVAHLAQADVSFTAVSRAPIHKLTAYAKRLGWTFPWVSSQGSSFNYDFAVSFTEEQRGSGKLVYNFGTMAVKGSDMPGFSVFAKNQAGEIFHTYSAYARGIDMMNPTFQCLDLVPKGRNEGPSIMSWVRRHDEYAR